MSQQLPISDAMLERAIAAVRRPRDNASLSTLQEVVARDVLNSAFEGVPLSNYGIGLALAAPFDLVIAYRAGSGALIFKAATDAEGEIDSLAHRLNVTMGKSGETKSLTFTQIGVAR